jgi:hypothetical protein
MPVKYLGTARSENLRRESVGTNLNVRATVVGMKKNNRFRALILLASTLVVPAHLAAQSGGQFSIQKSVIAGGGGRSTAGAFDLTGTIGQSAAGTTSSGGSFQVTGGFWGGGSGAPVSNVAIGGRVTALLGQSVPGVVLTAAGTPQIIANTDAAGFYSLLGVGSGAYTVTPTKVGDINGISGLDAARVAQHVAGLIVLNANQQIAGDATNNGSLSGLDAARIAQTAAGLPNPGIVGQWKFVPASRSYPTVAGSISNEDYTAIIVGDVTGNWAAPIPRPGDEADRGSEITASKVTAAGERKVPDSKIVGIDLPGHAVGAGGSEVTIPISIGDTTGRGIVAYDFTLVFDADELRPASVPTDISGTLSSGWTIVYNAETPGRLRVTAYNTGALSGDGALLNLRFSMTEKSSGSAELKWSTFELNEGQVPLKASSRQ